MGRVVPDKDHPGMWRSVKGNAILSGVANLSWSKDNVMAQAIREVAYESANSPSKPQQNRGSFRPKSSPIRLNAAWLTGCLRSNSRASDGRPSD